MQKVQYSYSEMNVGSEIFLLVSDRLFIMGLPRLLAISSTSLVLPYSVIIPFYSKLLITYSTLRVEWFLFFTRVRAWGERGGGSRAALEWSFKPRHSTTSSLNVDMMLRSSHFAGIWYCPKTVSTAVPFHSSLLVLHDGPMAVAFGALPRGAILPVFLMPFFLHSPWHAIAFIARIVIKFRRSSLKMIDFFAVGQQ